MTRLQGNVRLQPTQQKLGSVGADLVGRLNGNRQEGEDPRGVGKIVETDQRNILRNTQPAPLQFVEHAHRNGIVSSKNSRRIDARVQHLRHHVLAGQRLELAELDQPRILLDARLGQCDPVASHPVQRRRCAGRSGQHGDSLVSKGDQVAGECTRPGERVTDYTVNIPAGDLPVDDYRWRISGAQQRQVVAVGTKRGNHHAIDALADHHVEITKLFGGVFVGVAEEDGVAVTLCGIFDTAGDRGPERVLDIRQNQCEGVGSFGAQTLGDAAGHIAQFFDGPLDALLGHSVDVADAVEHPRHGHR